MIMQQFNRMAERGSGLEHLKTEKLEKGVYVSRSVQVRRLFNPGGSRRVKCPCEGRHIAPAF